MSNILFKQVQDNTVATPPNPGYVKLFSNINDSGKLYYKDSNGNSFIVGGGIGVTVSQVTYAGLSTLVSSNVLTPGMLYEITDYQTVYDRPNYYVDGSIKGTISTAYGATESLIVTALNTSTLDTHAFQPSYPLDSIKYDFQFTNTEINSTPAFGRITERVDEYGNRTDYDHRTVEYIRYQSYVRSGQLSGQITNVNFTNGILTGNGLTTFTSLATNDIILIDSYSSLGYLLGIKISNIISNSILEFYTDPSFTGSYVLPSNDFYSSSPNGVYLDWKEVYVGQEIDNDFILIKTFQTDSESPISSVNNFIGDSANYFNNFGLNHLLPNIVFGIQCYNNKLKGNSRNTTFPQLSTDNEIDLQFNNNCIYGVFQSNKIGESSSNNIIFNNFQYNIINSNFSSNLIGDFPQSSIFSHNKLSTSFNNNIIFGDFESNSTGNSFTSNVIDDRFMSNEIGVNFSNNTISSDFGISNSFKQSLGNKIGDYFQNNIIGVIGSVPANFYGNVIGNYFGVSGGNTILDGFQYNTIKEDFSANSIQSDFKRNNIGNEFRFNTIEDNFLCNTIGDLFQNNNIASNFGYDIYNSIEKGNQIGDNFRNNFIGTIGSIPADFWGNKIGNCFGVDTSVTVVGNSIQGTFTDNNIGENFFNNVIFSGFESNSIGNRFRDNLTNASFYSNTIGNDFSTNIVDVNFSYNIVTDDCQTNTFGIDCLDNKFGSLFVLNTIGDYFQYNNIGSFCSNNTVGATASNNKIGDEFSYNTIGLGLKHNKIGNKFLGNTIGDDFLSNEIGNFFGALNAGVANGNFILNTFAYNKIGNYFGNDGNWVFGSGTDGGNIVGDNFTYNNVGNNVIYNAFAFDFRRNVIGNEFWFNVFNVAGIVQDNFFGNLFVSNTGGGFPIQMAVTDFSSNKLTSSTGFNELLGLTFTNNSIGDNFDTNQIDTFVDNKIGSDFEQNIIGLGFSSNIILNQFNTNTINLNFANNQIGNGFANNTINDNMNSNCIMNGFDSNIISDNFQKNTITSGVTGFDFTSGPATHVYGDYDVTIFWNSTPALRLSYYDSLDTLTIVSPINS